jgi:hypothetical protein
MLCVKDWSIWTRNNYQMGAPSQPASPTPVTACIRDRQTCQAIFDAIFKQEAAQFNDVTLLAV